MTMLKVNNIKGLQHVLLVNLLTEVYKCINNIGLVYLCNHFKVEEFSHNLRDQNGCVLSKVNTVRHGIKNILL